MNDNLKGKEQSQGFINRTIECLQNYYDKSLLIKDLLSTEDDHNIDKINELLNQREELVNQYNILKKEFELLVDQTPDHSTKTLHDQRDKLVDLIRSVDSGNIERINRLFHSHKEKVRQVNEGRKMLNAYQGTQIMSDGVFVDKRK